MEGLVTQLRAVMLLMLVSALGVAWATTRKTPDLIALARDVVASDAWSESKRPEIVTKYQSLAAEDFVPDRTDVLLGLVPADILSQAPEVKYELASFGYGAAGEPTQELELIKRAELVASLDRFSAAVRETGIDPSKPLRESLPVIDAAGKIKLPLIEETIAPKQGLITISITQAILLLYSLSLVSTIRKRIPEEGVVEAVQLPFLHEGRLGLILWAIWLLSPVGGAAIAVVRTELPMFVRVVVPLTLAALALFGFMASVHVRHSYLDLCLIKEGRTNQPTERTADAPPSGDRVTRSEEQ